MTTRTRTLQSKTPRSELVLAARGLIAETFDGRTTTQSSLVLATGRVFATGIGLYAGETITNIVTHCTAGYTMGAGTISLVKFAVLDSTGVVLRSTADVQASFSAAGIKTLALSSTYQPTTTGLHYLCVLYVAGGTPPTTAPAIGRGSLDTIQGLPAAGGVPTFGYTSSTANTDMTGPFTIIATAASQPAYWFGVS